MQIVTRAIRWVTWLVGAVMAGAVLLYILEANSSNWLVGSVLDLGTWLASPFRSIFDFDENKIQIAVNYGIGIAVYVALGMALAALIAKLGAGRAPESEQDDTGGTKKQPSTA